MKERPIIMQGESVRGVQAGIKTQTRRVIKPQPKWFHDGSANLMWEGDCIFFDSMGAPSFRAQGIALDAEFLCPYGRPGDRLWVRETWRNTKCRCAVTGVDPIIQYRADAGYSCGCEPGSRAFKAWKPSIHMSRCASRLTLEVLSVRVERVQTITNEDCYAEGIEEWLKDESNHPSYPDGTLTKYINIRQAFAAMWDTINLSRNYGWDINPWVWVVEFKQHREAIP